MPSRHDQALVAIGVIAADLAVILAFEWLRPRGLSFDGLWNARTALWAGVLLFDNLLVLWWYADLTRQSVEAGREQARLTQQAVEGGREQARIAQEAVNVAHSQAQASADQLMLAREADKRAQRPCVVIEWQGTPSLAIGHAAGHTYVARNIGTGVALNVVHIENLDAPDLRLDHIGALGSGASVELPGRLVAMLNDETLITRRRHVLIAEPVGGDEWIVSENLKEGADRISHRIRTRALTAAEISQIHRVTGDEYIHEHWEDIKADLTRMLNALQDEHET